MAPIAISLEAVSTEVSLSSLQHIRFGAHFTAGDLIMPRISLTCQELVFTETDGLENRWRPGSCGTDVNRLPNCCSNFQLSGIWAASAISL